MKRIGVLLTSAAVVLSGVACNGGSDKPDVVAFFQNVGDLVPKAEVQVNDVRVGSVTNIQAVRRGSEMVARVELDVDDAMEIPSDGLKAVVRQTSLLGEQFIQLVPMSEAGPYVGDVPVTIG